jgi:hypothetical protein
LMVASIWSCTAPSFAQPVAMAASGIAVLWCVRE